jgi:hypothetical protein
MAAPLAPIPELAPYIDIGIEKLEDYVGEAWKTQIYVHAMGKSFLNPLIMCSDLCTVLNPCMKFDWMEKHWGKNESEKACEWVKELV